MNLPNKLTLARVLMVPIFVICYCISFPGHYFSAAVIFSLASITDAVDGKLARDRHQITNFGKFLDPLADKILIVATLSCLLQDQRINIVVFLLIVCREFMVSGVRLVVAGKGTVVPAGFLGKLKTAFTMIALVTGLVYLSFRYDFNAFGLRVPNAVYFGIEVFLDVVFWIAAVLTVWSGVQYLVHYWDDINPNK